MEIENVRVVHDVIGVVIRLEVVEGGRLEVSFSGNEMLSGSGRGEIRRPISVERLMSRGG